jgi:hypothetical protein
MVMKLHETLIISLFINRVPSHQICLCGIEFNAHEISHDTPLRVALYYQDVPMC